MPILKNKKNMIEMIPAEYYPQLYEELKTWREQNPQKESAEEKQIRLRAEFERAKQAMNQFELINQDK